MDENHKYIEISLIKLWKLSKIAQNFKTLRQFFPTIILQCSKMCTIVINKAKFFSFVPVLRPFVKDDPENLVTAASMINLMRNNWRCLLFAPNRMLFRHLSNPHEEKYQTVKYFNDSGLNYETIPPARERYIYACIICMVIGSDVRVRSKASNSISLD